ncbi:hypothetical protein ACWCOY_21775 [Streptomyces tubercidicus]
MLALRIDQCSSKSAIPLSLDGGVCMEIGYAAASGIPVLLLTTDFQTSRPTPSPRTALTSTSRTR